MWGLGHCGLAVGECGHVLEWNGLVACVGRGVVVALQATKDERTNKSGDHMSGASEISTKYDIVHQTNPTEATKHECNLHNNLEHNNETTTINITTLNKN